MCLPATATLRSSGSIRDFLSSAALSTVAAQAADQKILNGSNGSIGQTGSSSKTAAPEASANTPARATSRSISAFCKGAVHPSRDETAILSPRRLASARLAGMENGIGHAKGSRGSGRLMTSSRSAASSTVRAIGPTTESGISISGGNAGTRPKLGLRPKTLVDDAGIRIEPAPSLPTASGPKPSASAADAPPDEPPGVLVRS